MVFDHFLPFAPLVTNPLNCWHLFYLFTYLISNISHSSVQQFLLKIIFSFISICTPSLPNMKSPLLKIYYLAICRGPPFLRLPNLSPKEKRNCMQVLCFSGTFLPRLTSETKYFQLKKYT